MVWNEKRCFRIRDQVFSVSKSEGRASSFFGIIAAYQNTGVEKDQITMDFMVGLPLTGESMTQFWS